MNGDTVTSNDSMAAAAYDAEVQLEAVRPTLQDRAARIWEPIERRLVHAGDWLNPILVKETRQALKSFQFTTTFVLVDSAAPAAPAGRVGGA